MTLEQLSITHFRNLKKVNFCPSKQVNIVFGLNGSGKTSLLEAVYYIGHNRSFRSHLNRRIIHYDAERFQLFAKLINSSVGIEKSIDKTARLRINNQEVLTIAEITRHFPIQLIDTESYQLLDGGPEFRRQFLDWGVFYTEPAFIGHWKQCQKVIKQRNACLRAGLSPTEVQSWDEQLIEQAKVLNQLRQSYFKQYLAKLTEKLSGFPLYQAVKLDYYPGWTREKDYAELLKANYQRDSQLGYTSAGPHRADIRIKIDGIPCKDVFSRGQKKLFVALLRVVQAELLNESQNLASLLLIDDLSSELDREKQQQLLHLVKEAQLQTLITNIEDDYLRQELMNPALFHVEQGCIEQVG